MKKYGKHFIPIKPLRMFTWRTTSLDLEVHPQLYVPMKNSD